MMESCLISNPKYKFNHEEILKHQSVEVEGEPGVRRSPLVGDKEFVSYLFEDTKTALECFLRGMKTSNNGPCLGYRPGNFEVPYEWIPYKDVWKSAKCIGSWLMNIGLEPGDFLGTYTQQCVESGVMELACYAYSLVIVSIYTTSTNEIVQRSINQTKVGTIMTDCNGRAQSLIKNQNEGHTNSLKNIIVIEEPDDETINMAEDAGISVIWWNELEEIGLKNVQEIIPPKPDDLCCISFTSGSSGNQKPAMITHKKFVTDIATVAISINFYTKITKDTIYMSYLAPNYPERMSHGLAYMYGSSIGFARGNDHLMNDIIVLKPTAILLLPLLMQKLYENILADVNRTYFTSMLFHFAMRQKLCALNQGILRTDTIWDKFVFHKTQALLGGRLQIAFTGGCPVKPEVLNFCQIAFGVPIIIHYGQTESSFTSSLFGDFTGDNVGSVMPGCHVKLVDVVEKGYFTKDGYGEICSRGPTVFSGYYNDAESTAAVLDKDGWLRSGDLGHWLPNGSLKLIGRKSCVYKMTNHRKWIVPANIELVYGTMKIIEQIFVYGNSLTPGLVAIVVLQAEDFTTWCKNREISLAKDLKNNKEITSLVLQEMRGHGESDLRDFEQVRAIRLVDEKFTVENDLLTPTLKLRRTKLKKYFESEIDEMFHDVQIGGCEPFAVLN